MDLSGPIDVSAEGEIDAVAPSTQIVELAHTGLETFGFVAIALVLLLVGFVAINFARS